MPTLLGLMKRRPGLSPEAFQAHWAGPHAELARRVPGLRRYVQNHTRLSGYGRAREPIYDGVAEIVFDDDEAIRLALASDEMAAAQADEAAFLDRGQFQLVVTDEHAIVDRPAPRGAVKLISFLTRRSDLTVEAFQSHWREKHGPIAATVPGMRRYVQCHTRVSSYRSGAPPAYDGVPLAWFDDTDSMRASDGSDAYLRTRADEAHFLEPGRIAFLIAGARVIVG